MAHFSDDFIPFFKELTANNSKEWMDKNRKRYEKEVRDPFKEFVQDMILRIRQFDEEVGIKPRDAIFRINNDIRFNPDKPLYKSHVAAVISKRGRKNMNYPGFYFQLGPEQVMVAGGAYMIEKSALNTLRKQIAQDPQSFYKAVNDQQFKDAFGKIRGEENKRLPADLSEAAGEHPIIFKKQFYYSAEFSSDYISGDLLPDKLMEYWHAGRGFNEYLIETLY